MHASEIKAIPQQQSKIVRLIDDHIVLPWTVYEQDPVVLEDCAIHRGLLTQSIRDPGLPEPEHHRVAHPVRPVAGIGKPMYKVMSSISSPTGKSIDISV